MRKPNLIKEIISNTISEFLNEIESNNLTVFHGTIPKFVDDIKNNGLEDRTSSPYQQGWYMVATDFESALFHAHPNDEKDLVYVFEFKIPNIENNRWLGYPYLWLGEKRNDNSTWFALMQKLPSNFITKVHEIPYIEWVDRKNKSF